MIRYYFPLFILLISFSCTRHYFQYNQDYLNEIPLETHTKKIPFYFPGEQLPKDPYVKIKVFEIKGTYGASFSSMLKTLERKARHTGVDAVMIISNDKNVYAKYDRTLIDEIFNSEDENDPYSNVTNYEVSTVIGVGIKFLKNMEGIKNQVKKSEILVYNNDEKQNKASVYYDFNNNVIKTEGDAYFTHLVVNYSLHFLANDYSSKWKYRKEGDNVLTRFLFDSSGSMIKQCTVNYINKKVSSVFVKDVSDRFRKMDKILFFYDSQGKLEHKELILKDGNVMKQYFEREDDKVVKSVFYKYKAGKETKYFEVINQFFSVEDIPQEMIVEND